MASVAVLSAACAPQPEPRSVLDFMEDGLARDGVLTRCSRDRAAAANDRECINARRAAAMIAIEAERTRAAELEKASEAARLALREREARRAALEQEQAEAARAAAEAAYEAIWQDPDGPRPAGNTEPPPAAVFGAPLGPVLPSIAGSETFDVYANRSDKLAPPALEVAVEPPMNDLVISPRIDMADLTAVPRPFRTAAE